MHRDFGTDLLIASERSTLKFVDENAEFICYKLAHGARCTVLLSAGTIVPRKNLHILAFTTCGGDE